MSTVDWPSLIDNELKSIGDLPCRVDEMTPREFAIFKILASHNGFLQFMRDRIKAA